MFAVALRGFIQADEVFSRQVTADIWIACQQPSGHLRTSALISFRSSPYSTEVVRMSKSKFTEADVRRAVKGVFDGGGRVSSVEIWPDGRISVTVKEDKKRSIDPEDDPEVSRRLL
jgi:hypothetical protein